MENKKVFKDFFQVVKKWNVTYRNLGNKLSDSVLANVLFLQGYTQLWTKFDSNEQEVLYHNWHPLASDLDQSTIENISKDVKENDNVVHDYSLNQSLNTSSTVRSRIKSNK
jgi:hypothetical protein